MAEDFDVNKDVGAIVEDIQHHFLHDLNGPIVIRFSPINAAAELIVSNDDDNDIFNEHGWSVIGNDFARLRSRLYEAQGKTFSLIQLTIEPSGEGKIKYSSVISPVPPYYTFIDRANNVVAQVLYPITKEQLEADLIEYPQPQNEIDPWKREILGY